MAHEILIKYGILKEIFNCGAIVCINMDFLLLNKLKSNTVQSFFHCSYITGIIYIPYYPKGSAR